MYKKYINHNKINTNRNYFVVNINWGSILFYVYFIAYGYYGALTRQIATEQIDSIMKWVITILLTIILILIGLGASKFAKQLNDKITINKYDAFCLLSYLTLTTTITINQLSKALIGDEIAYAMASQGQSLYITQYLINKTQIFDDIKFKNLMQWISILLLIGLVGLVYFTVKRSWSQRIIIVTCFFIIFRLAYIYLGGNPSPHTPLNLIPLFLVSTLLGIDDVSFKLSYLMVFNFFLLLLYKQLTQSLTKLQSHLTVLAVATIPLLLNLATTVEQSLYGSIFLIFILIEIASNNKQINPLRISVIMAIGVLFRIPLFLVSVIISIYLVIQALNSKKLVDANQKNDLESAKLTTLLIIAPSIIYIPILIESVFTGTPSVSINKISTIDNLTSLYQSNIIFISLLNSLPVWWIFLLPFPFLSWPKAKNLNILFLLLFFFLIILFYSINPRLWGLAKYQAEYAIPFAVLGFIYLLSFIMILNFNNRFVVSALMFFVLLNLKEYYTIPERIKPIDELLSSAERDSKSLKSGYGELIAMPFNMKDAFKDIVLKGFTESTYNAGITYGILPEIMSGYNVKSVKFANQIWLTQKNLMKMNNIPWGSANFDLIASDSRINAVILGFVNPDKKELTAEFINNGWKVMGIYEDEKFKSTVITFIR
jgi:hypothetical protein